MVWSPLVGSVRLRRFAPALWSLPSRFWVWSPPAPSPPFPLVGSGWVRGLARFLSPPLSVSSPPPPAARNMYSFGTWLLGIQISCCSDRRNNQMGNLIEIRDPMAIFARVVIMLLVSPLVVVSLPCLPRASLFRGSPPGFRSVPCPRASTPPRPGYATELRSG